MIIRTITHKGIRRFMEHGNNSDLSPAVRKKLPNILTILQGIEEAEELRDYQQLKAHMLVGQRKDTWSLKVTANLRLTFIVELKSNEILDLNLEDYH